MPYSQITWLGLQNALSARLDDTNQVFWSQTEIQILLTEALRMWGLLSAFWRDRGTFSTTPNQVFYDIPSSITPGLLDYTVTDYNIIQAIQYHFLENATSQKTWLGTEMFDMNDLSYAIQRRLNQFIQDTGIVVSYSNNIPGPTPPDSRFFVSDNTVDVRRLAWVDSFNRYYRLYKEDEQSMSFYVLGWPQIPGVPNTYSVLAERPLEIQLQPPPLASGSLEMLSVDTTNYKYSNLNSTILPLFDDLTPFIKWGAMADCLGMDGPARDPIRADFCEQRYQQGVEFAKLLGLVVHSRINNVPTRPVNLADLDTYSVNWQNTPNVPTDFGQVGWNMGVIYPPPNGIYGITLDVIRKAIIPVNSTDYVQIGREQINSILDYAENLALFKIGGKEFEASIRQGNDFLIETATYNKRLSAMARYIVTAKGFSQDEIHPNPREMNTVGLGAGPASVGSPQQGK